MKKGTNTFIKSVAAAVLGLLAGGILMLTIGKNPLAGYFHLFQGGLMSLERIGNTLATATALILTGLSVAFAFRTGLFNIGAAGQMLIGGLCATAVGLTLPLPKVILVPVVVLAAIVGGALWGIIPGFLKAKFNVHEVVATIMMNWTAYWIVYYVIPAYFKANQETESAHLPYAAQLRVNWLSDFFGSEYVSLGIFIAIAVVFLIKFILDRTTLGYELKAVGFNRFAAEYAGIKVNRNIILSMMIAGALSGLAGAVYFAGYATNMEIGLLPSQGFDGIAVALLGANSPIGVLLAAIFFGLLHSGKGFMNAMTGIPPQISDTIIAVMIYFTATSLFIERMIKRYRNKKQNKDDDTAVPTGGDQ